MNVINIAAAAVFAASLASHVAPALADAPCDGVYQSHGRGCHGTLFIRNKTIEWNSPWSVCKSSPHKILGSALDHKPRRVVYQIVRPSKACRYEPSTRITRPRTSCSFRAKEAVASCLLVQLNSAPASKPKQMTRTSSSAAAGRLLT